MGRYEAWHDVAAWMVAPVSGSSRGIPVACFWITEVGSCPNAEREARALCRRLNVAAKKPKPKPKKKGKVKR